MIRPEVGFLFAMKKRSGRLSLFARFKASVFLFLWSLGQIMLTDASMCSAAEVALIDPAGPSSPWSAFGIDERTVHGLIQVNSALYAATDSGVFKRVLSAGSSWESLGLSGVDIRDIFHASDPPATFYAGVFVVDQSNEQSVSIYRSTDDGENWVRADTGIGPNRVLDIEGSASSNSFLYAAASSVFRSDDQGMTWNQVWQGTTTVTIAIDPNVNGTVYAGGGTFIETPSLLKSENGGGSWRSLETRLGTGFVASLAIDPRDSETVFAGMRGQIYKTTDGGETRTLTDVPKLAQTNQVLIDLSVVDHLYAGGLSILGDGSFGFALFESRDGGESWGEIEGPDPKLQVLTMVFDQNDSTIIYIGTQCGVYRLDTKLIPTAVGPPRWRNYD